VETALSAAAPLVEGSENQLKQVFLNLIVNASDAMPSGGVLRVESRLSDGGVLLVFRDTGSGILPEHLDKVFDAFFTTKSQASGVGLGLSVSYGIVQRHRGTIRVESAPAKGSAFSVWLPLAGRPAEAVAKAGRG
jgi:two-component system NtrC family sensor kinase